MSQVRSPFVVVMGHVDVGKTLLLDKIRGTSVAYREPGMITQHIGMSFVPWSAVEKFAGPLVDRLRLRGRIWIPGFLFIDTPGHAAFSNLRKRGGSVADLAILVVDITSGLEEQGVESLKLIQSRGVPFVIAANKLDRIYGWKSVENRPFLFAVEDQEWHAVATLEERIGKLIEELSRHGIDADRYDRVRDFSKQVPIVPTSAVTGEGIADLLLVLAGVSQRFIPRERLQVREGPAKGVVMEVKEERGLGVVADVILYDGTLRKGDVLVTASLEGPKEARVRMLIMPKPLEEMRDPEDKFMAVEEVKAAAGVRVVADGLEGVVAGSPLIAVWDPREIPNACNLVKEEISEIRIESDKEGVIVRADTFGTLESIVLFLRQQGVPVRKADVGPPTHKDVVEAVLSRRKNPIYGVILAFNVKTPPEVEKEAMSSGIKIIAGEILYRIFDEYIKWSQEVRTKTIEQILSQLTRPGKIQILPGFVFRRSDPAIVGVKVLAGTIKPGVTLVKDGREVGRIMQIQKTGRAINEAAAGDEVAISIHGDVIVGRQIKEGDILYVYVPDDQARQWLFQYRQYLREDELKALEEYLKSRRK
ncbi:translation initiation factor IF-2 (infB), putative [Pyrobaculum aerophilum str. IM2]|uniref:Probable translation initiation factor IF-2 n=2 Tax=Pyrobaculum aerophilum TaxID=13773 RepID=IF2P_PYRAE|nr:translation initiation factor IF-2 [Pyrobaculum aerophilum]Q8ZX20.1 RecName: Full=Probable translation initiation factor IF-2 [Pyrobaculum aerophilum str. IM2]AAL63529.1 translation initiation factor IF-2 (infB), putative [Pyrobaculum aerophilum str. IM2]HII46397.1 translation initiation factor IF-2 [Pyrobaculum aerophilum]